MQVFISHTQLIQIAYKELVERFCIYVIYTIHTQCKQRDFVCMTHVQFIHNTCKVRIERFCIYVIYTIHTQYVQRDFVCMTHIQFIHNTCKVRIERFWHIHNSYTICTERVCIYGPYSIHTQYVWRDIAHGC